MTRFPVPVYAAATNTCPPAGPPHVTEGRRGECVRTGWRREETHSEAQVHGHLGGSTGIEELCNRVLFVALHESFDLLQWGGEREENGVGLGALMDDSTVCTPMRTALSLKVKGF